MAMRGCIAGVCLVAISLFVTPVCVCGEPGREDHCTESSRDLSSAMPGIAVTPSTAVIVCPGGSYFWRANPAEGTMTVDWLRDEGIHAIRLDYTVGGWFAFTFHSRVLSGRSCYPAVLDELRSAVADLHGKGYSRVGVMGFSAGGHLALLGAEYARNSAECPDFVAALYPVVTMSDERIVHKRSRRGLIGERMIVDSALCDSLSLEKNIPCDMPPVFLLCCDDDRVVDPANSRIMDDALCRTGVPHSFMRLPSGGHGFGADKSRFNSFTSSWQSSFIAWLKNL